MKPYPWKCRTCREREVRPAEVDYSTEVEHDGRTYHVRVPGLAVLRCDACGALVLDDEALEKVSNAFRYEAGLLMPAQIRKKREALGLTQKQLAVLLGVSEWSLSRWETGAQIQQRAMNNLLKGFFDVPEFRAHLGYEETRQGNIGAAAGASS
jgi:putative zinc finger/helix-turn-helix YgiT family protein